jgi:hypothetical protein
MTFLVIFVVFLTIWMLSLLYTKKEARLLLCKYGNPLPWIRSNSIFLMMHRLRELKKKGVIENDDISEYRFIMCTLKWTLILFPVVMIIMLIISFVL